MSLGRMDRNMNSLITGCKITRTYIYIYIYVLGMHDLDYGVPGANSPLVPRVYPIRARISISRSGH